MYLATQDAHLAVWLQRHRTSMAQQHSHPSGWCTPFCKVHIICCVARPAQYDSLANPPEPSLTTSPEHGPPRRPAHAAAHTLPQHGQPSSQTHGRKHAKTRTAPAPIMPHRHSPLCRAPKTLLLPTRCMGGPGRHIDFKHRPRHHPQTDKDSAARSAAGRLPGVRSCAVVPALPP